MVFYCDWFDPSRKGTRVDPKYNVVDIRMYARYPFIIAHNVWKMYYIQYPATQMDKHGCCVAIKTKGHIRI